MTGLVKSNKQNREFTILAEQQLPIIEAQNVNVELSGETILQNINLQIFEGETVVIIGPSGSGKTVLLKTLAGLYNPSKGSIKFHGISWSGMSDQKKHELARFLGMQFQKAALFDEYNTIDNIKYVLREHTSLTEQEIERRALECLTLVNLQNARNLQPHELSGGMKIRLGVARSLALSPQILFMDDPTAGLDPVNSDEMADLIISLKQQINATLIVVTHDMMRAYQFAGRILFVVEKTILETGSIEHTINHKDPRVQQFIHGWQKGPLSPEVTG